MSRPLRLRLAEYALTLALIVVARLLWAASTEPITSQLEFLVGHWQEVAAGMGLIGIALRLQPLP